MPDSPISDLPAVVTPDDGDVLVVVQGGVNKQLTVAQLRSMLIPANLWVMTKSTPDQTLTNNQQDLITFDAATVDGGGSVIDLANDRFVAPATGAYFVVVNWNWGTTAPTGGAYIEVQVNGAASTHLVRSSAATNTGFGSLGGVFPVYVTAGDFITVKITPGAVSGVIARSGSITVRTSMSLLRIA